MFTLTDFFPIILFRITGWVASGCFVGHCVDLRELKTAQAI